MNREHWIEKLNIPREAEVIFYQNPDFFRSNSFQRDYDDERFVKLKKMSYHYYNISGICNRHHKHNGKRHKICLVIERTIC